MAIPENEFLLLFRVLISLTINVYVADRCILWPKESLK